MVRKSSKTATDAVKTLHRRYIEGNAIREVSLQAERDKAGIAGQIYDLRVRAGLTQTQLARRISGGSS